MVNYPLEILKSLPLRMVIFHSFVSVPEGNDDNGLEW